MSAREEILGRVRANLTELRARTPAPVADRTPFARFGTGLEGEHAKLDHFQATLEGVGGQCARVADEAAAAAHVRGWLQERGAQTLAVCDGALAARVADAVVEGGALELVSPGAERETLLTVDAGLTGARLGIAETGTLALASTDERSRLTSLLPPLAIAILSRDQLVATLEDAMTALRPDAPESNARAITFVTGPSRTADIEMTLVVGVHGPKELLVVVLDPDS